MNPCTSSVGEVRVVFIGDSIIGNWDLHRDFPGEGWINRGIGGQRTMEILGRFSDDALAIHPNAIVLLAGSNDLAKGVPLEAIIANLREMIQMSVRQGVRTLISSVLPVSDYHKARNAEFERTKDRPPESILAINRAIAALAAQEGAVYLDLHSRLANPSGFLPAAFADDGLHPNEAGYAAIAPLVIRSIKSSVNSIETSDLA